MHSLCLRVVYLCGVQFLALSAVMRQIIVYRMAVHFCAEMCIKRRVASMSLDTLAVFYERLK